MKNWLGHLNKKRRHRVDEGDVFEDEVKYSPTRKLKKKKKKKKHHDRHGDDEQPPPYNDLQISHREPQAQTPGNYERNVNESDI